MAAVAGDSTGAGDDGGRDRDGDGDAQPVPSGLLTHLPGGRTEAAVLAAALRQLSTLARALSRNVRLLNGGLERTLQDKKDIEELEGILNRFVEGQARDLKSLVARH